MDKVSLKQLLGRRPNQHPAAHAGADIAVTASAAANAPLVSTIQHRAFSQVLHAILTMQNYTAVEQTAPETDKGKRPRPMPVRKGDTTAVDDDEEEEEEDKEEDEAEDEKDTEEEKIQATQQDPDRLTPPLTSLEAWVECLDAVPSNVLPLYPNIDSLLVLLAAHLNQRHLRPAVQLQSPLACFFRRGDVQMVMAQRLCNAYIDTKPSSGPAADNTAATASASSAAAAQAAAQRQPALSEIEWSALVTLLRLQALPTPCDATCRYLAGAVTSGLNAVLDGTPQVWHGSNLSLQTRGHIQDMFSAIQYLCPLSLQDTPPAPTGTSTGTSTNNNHKVYSALNGMANAKLSAVMQSALYACGCCEVLLQISARLEDGSAYHLHTDLVAPPATATAAAESPAASHGSQQNVDYENDNDSRVNVDNMLHRASPRESSLDDGAAEGADSCGGDDGDTIAGLISNFYGHVPGNSGGLKNQNVGIPPVVNLAIPEGTRNEPGTGTGTGTRTRSFSNSPQRRKAAAKTRLLQLRRQHQVECRMSIQRTQWCEMCLTAVMKLYIWVQKNTRTAATTVVAHAASNTKSAVVPTIPGSTKKRFGVPGAGATSTTAPGSAPTTTPHSTPAGTSADSRSKHGHQFTLQMGISMLHSLCWQRRILGLVSLIELMRIPDIQTSSSATGAGTGAATAGASASASAGGDIADSAGSSTANNTAKDTGGASKSRKGQTTTNNTSSVAKGAKPKARDSSNGKSAAGSSGSSSGAANNVNAIRRQRTQNNIISIRPVEELCKSGHIRALCWNLLNKRGQIRLYAAELLQSIMLQAEREEIGTLVWAAFVEQGLVPLLEVVASGLPISYLSVSGAAGAVTAVGNQTAAGGAAGPKSGTLFPENSVRRTAYDMLLCLASHLHHSHVHTTHVSMPTTAFLLLQQRLSSALLHSGNKALRNNIFVGMLYLQPRHASLGRSLWAMPGSQLGQSLQGIGAVGNSDSGAGAGSNPNPNGEVFREMLSALSRDKTELTPILVTIAHIVHVAAALSRQNVKGEAAVERSTAASAAAAAAKEAQSNRLQNGCTVLVTNEGQLTRMRCPAVAVVRYHCPAFALILEKSEANVEAYACLQAQQAGGAAVVGGAGAEKQPSLPILAGDYALWQEIFSHMLDLEDDNNMCGPSLQRMSTSMVVNAFHIARRFHMQILLSKYATVLCSRIGAETLVSILAASLGIEEDEKTGAKRYLRELETSNGSISHMEESLFASTRADSSGIPPNQNVQLRMHVRLCSACLAYFEKHLDRLFFGGLLSTSSAASSRQQQAHASNHVRQMELLELLHGVLGVIFEGSIAGSTFM